jgi:ankyrin repeat protein
MRHQRKVDLANARFREYAMHGSVDGMKRYEDLANVNGREAGSERTALHKAAFWGHTDAIAYLVARGATVDAQDGSGDTAFHDAARFGHAEVCRALLTAGACPKKRNNEGLNVLETAVEYGKDAIVQMLRASARL